MTLSRLSKLLIVAALAVPAPGCLIHQVDKDPQPPIDLPERFAGSAEDTQTDPGRWWTGFNDPELNRLIDAALDHNLQLRQAWARVEQAKALRKIATAGMFPTVGASLSANRSQSAPRVFNLGGQETTMPGVQSDTFSASLPVSYELDLWGRVRSGMLAAEQDVIAVRADVETAATTIAATVAESYFDIVEQRARRQLVEGQQRTSKLLLELVTLRFGYGQVGLSDIYQQRQQLQALQAQIELVDGQEQTTEQQLALLLGLSPQGVSGQRAELPAPPALPPAGVPSSLLQRRPDLRAARARVLAADYRLGQAIAAQFPVVGLQGSIGFSATELGQLFESFIWSITGAITASIWDGGARSGEVDRSRAVLEERLYAYGEALLKALGEVESTLVMRRQQLRTIAILEQQVETARRTLELAQRRFSSGIGTFLPVLTASASLQLAEQNLLTARRQLLSLHVQLYRALGSKWTSELSAPGEEGS